MKKRMILLSIILLVIGVIFINRKQEEQILDVNSLKINEETSSIFAMYKNDTGEPNDDQKIDIMPTEGYEIDTDRSYCYTTDKDHLDEVDLHTNEAGDHIIGSLKEGSKCFLYFNKKKLPPLEQTLANLGIKDDIIEEDLTTFTGTSCESGCTYTQNGLYKGTDDDGDTYYYRGTVDNNWVHFANLYWRIIRINGDGSIRLIYAGTSSDDVGEKGNGKNALTNQEYNKSNDDNTYVGFTNAGGSTNSYEQARTGTSESDILKELNTWYISNLQTFEENIEKNTGFCNDRHLSQSTHGLSYTNKGYGIEQTWYAPFDRVAASTSSSSYAGVGKEQKPTLKCGSTEDDFKKDYYTVKTASRGNQKLDHPIGLITMDEVIYAGGFAGQNNTGYWLYIGDNYWTMSPRNYLGSAALVFFVTNGGNLDREYVIYTHGVRPVINLKADVSIKYDKDSDKDPGTIDNPYEVV